MKPTASIATSRSWAARRSFEFRVSSFKISVTELLICRHQRMRRVEGVRGMRPLPASRHVLHLRNFNFQPLHDARQHTMLRVFLREIDARRARFGDAVAIGC